MWALVRDTAGVSSALDPIVAALERRPDLRGLGAGDLARVLGIPIASAVATLRALGGETWDRALVRAGRPAPIVQLGDLRARARGGDDAGIYDVSPAIPLPPGTTTPYVRALPLAKVERVKWRRPQDMSDFEFSQRVWTDYNVLPGDTPSTDPRFIWIEMPQNPADVMALREMMGWSKVQAETGDPMHNAPYHDLDAQALVFQALRQWSPLPEDQQLDDTDPTAPWYGWHGYGQVRFIYGWTLGAWNGPDRFKVGQWMQVQKYEAYPVPQGADPPWVPGSKGGRWYIFSSGGIDRMFTRWSGDEPWTSHQGWNDWWSAHGQEFAMFIADMARIGMTAAITIFTMGLGSAASAGLALMNAAQTAMMAAAKSFSEGATDQGLMHLGEMLLKLGSLQISDSATIADAIGKSALTMASPVMAGAFKFIAQTGTSDVSELATAIAKDVVTLRKVADVTRLEFDNFKKMLPPSEQHYAEIGWKVGTAGSFTLDQVRATVPWYAVTAFDAAVTAGAIDQAQHYPPHRAKRFRRSEGPGQQGTATSTSASFARPVSGRLSGQQGTATSTFARFAPMSQKRPVLEGSPGAAASPPAASPAAVPLAVGGALAAWFLL